MSAYTNDIDKALEAAHDQLSMLIGRIEPVLRPEPPTATGREGTNPPRLIESPLAERQVAHKNAIDALYRRIEGVLERLDL